MKLSKGEENDQILLMNWLHIEYPKVWGVTHHSPNGGQRHKAVAQKMKLMGVKKGFPDLISYWPMHGYLGLVLEIKYGSGKTTQEQDEWLEWFRVLGYSVWVANGLENGKEVFLNYFRGDGDGN